MCCFVVFFRTEGFSHNQPRSPQMVNFHFFLQEKKNLNKNSMQTHDLLTACLTQHIVSSTVSFLLLPSLSSFSFHSSLASPLRVSKPRLGLFKLSCSRRKRVGAEYSCPDLTAVLPQKQEDRDVCCILFFSLFFVASRRRRGAKKKKQECACVFYHGKQPSGNKNANQQNYFECSQGCCSGCCMSGH